jgi:hypothetical protein
LDFYSDSSLKQQSADRHVTPLGHIILIPSIGQVNCQWDDDDEVHFVLDQHAYLDFYSDSSLKQQFANRHVTPLRHIILIPSQAVCSFSLY